MNDDALQLRRGGLWHRIASHLAGGPVHGARLFIRVRDPERARAKARSQFWRAVDLMARAGLVERLGSDGVALTPAGRAQLVRLDDQLLRAAWAHASDQDLARAVAEASDPAQRQARARALELRQQERTPA